jgi:DNA-binding helix-hairpin-helix protein with protein kinase domain
MSYTTANGTEILLGNQRGKRGGEGTVYAVDGRPNMVAKILHLPKRTPARETKIRTMVSRKPTRRTVREKNSGKIVPTLAWPEEVILEDGKFAGFLMGAIDMDQAAEIAIIENPRRRENRSWTQTMGLGLRSFIAMNLSFVVGQVHNVDAVIGDFNERNVIVSKELIVSIIDCDSMQIKDPTGTYHFCEMFTPGFMAPELVGKDLSQEVRPVGSDLFNLAVHIYCLLLDRHPFRNGIFSGTGDKPPAEDLARQGQWRGRIGGILRPTEPKSLDPRLVLPPSTIRLFERAFEAGVTRPDARPAAVEWQQNLRQFIGTRTPK